ncbi:MAG: MlaD family protein [Proteobacteria bacterium]|nr:MlaD family protein [Pseudomonadota bacterium]MDA1057093.1 MlaD family protein [Pseudomonadota bacterium]
MENRANYILVGSFVLLVVLGLFGFVIWLAKLEVDREFARYTIYFEGSVAGLSTASSVLYNGIPVGNVQSIRIDPRNPQQVLVLVDIATDTPVKIDSVAELQAQGITGVSLVALTGGSVESPALTEILPGERFPVIDSRPSQFQRLFQGAPDLIARGVELLEQSKKLVNNENIQALSSIIIDVQALSGELASRSEDLGSILDNVERTSGEMRKAAVSLNSLVETLDIKVDTLSDSADATLAVLRGAVSTADGVIENDLRNLIQAVTQVSDGLDSIIKETRQPLADFSAEGLYEFSGLIADMRALMGDLSRLTTAIESDPAQFLFGDAQRGFETQ